MGVRISAMAAAAVLAGFGTVRAAEDSAWIRIFNGKDLNDWDVKMRYQALNKDSLHTFKVQDGNLFVDYSEYKNFDREPFGHAGYKVRPFSFYLLRAEYQFLTGKQVAGGPGWAKENNGFMLHSQSMASMGLNQDFPISMETQLLGAANGGSTMNLCTPGTHYHDMAGKLVTDHCVNATSVAKPAAPAWMSVSALVLGDSVIKHMVGKDTVFRYTKPVTGGGNVSGNTVQVVENAPLKSGYIVIQAESAPVLFRRIDVLDLVGCMEKASPSYRTYFVRHDAKACQTVSALGGKREVRFGLERDGAWLRVTGEGARIAEVRRADGSFAVRFGADAGTAYRPDRTGLYILTVRTGAGSAARKFAFF